MAQYIVTFTDGGSDVIVTATNLELCGNEYIAWAGDGSAVAYIPARNVRAIIRQDAPAVNG
ncbi:hypothetical protein [Streptomyces sp. NPDC059783]|uniref:hypothetical protein n=1 Tax=Streptomyces sp. NPDC059783 TaxID=3346944 RepID=UPI00365EF6DE